MRKKLASYYFPTLMNISLPSFPLLWGPPVWASLCSREDNSCKLETMKFRWLNYFLVLTLFNVILHICYLYILLGAHDSMDQTASSLYSFEQVVRRRRGALWVLTAPCRPSSSARERWSTGTAAWASGRRSSPTAPRRTWRSVSTLRSTTSSLSPWSLARESTTSGGCTRYTTS